MGDPVAIKNVEIKVSLSADTVVDALDKLKLKPDKGEQRTIYFCEMPERAGDAVRLPLLNRDIILRLRIEDDSGDVTVKLRPCDTAGLPKPWRADKKGEDWTFRIEEDWAGHRRVVAASLQAEHHARDIDAVAAGRRPLADVLTQEQRELLEGYVTRVGGPKIDPSRLALLGPIDAIKWRPARHDLVCPVVAEQWSIGDERLFLELSLRVKLRDGSVAQGLLEQSVSDYKLPTDAAQQTKTRMVMARLAESYLTGRRQA